MTPPGPKLLGGKIPLMAQVIAGNVDCVPRGHASGSPVNKPLGQGKNVSFTRKPIFSCRGGYVAVPWVAKSRCNRDAKRQDDNRKSEGRGMRDEPLLLSIA